MRRVAIFDLDGTITRKDTYRAYLLGYMLRKPGVWPNAALLPAELAAYKLLRHDNAWLKERFLTRILGGRSRRDVDQWTRVFVERKRSKGLRPGAVEQIQKHKREGDLIIVATASFSFYVKPLVSHFEPDECICTEALWHEDDRLVGKIDGYNCYGERKLERVKALLGAERESTEVTAYSDHASDLPLLTWADRGVFVNPGRKDAAKAGKLGLDVAWW